MYGNGIAPIAGGLGGAGALVSTGGVLAHTGSGGFILPIVIATIGLTLGALLIWRAAWIRRREQTTGTTD
jgi:hypothetical protein